MLPDCIEDWHKLLASAQAGVIVRRDCAEVSDGLECLEHHIVGVHSLFDYVADITAQFQKG